MKELPNAKNIILLFLIFISVSSCEWFTYTPQQCSSAVFSFVDSDGNNLFADSLLSVEDFQVIEVKGTSSAKSYDMPEFEVFFSREKSDYNTFNDTVIALFEFTGFATDTVVVTIEENKKELFIKKLFYNGELLEDNDNYRQCGNWHFIVK